MMHPLGIKSLKKLRERGIAYVDKIIVIYDLGHNGMYYFLNLLSSLGKRLLLSPLELYFKGHKDLFEGMIIAEFGEALVRYPVIRIYHMAGFGNFTLNITPLGSTAAAKP